MPSSPQSSSTIRTTPPQHCTTGNTSLSTSKSGDHATSSGEDESDRATLSSSATSGSSPGGPSTCSTLLLDSSVHDSRPGADHGLPSACSSGFYTSQVAATAPWLTTIHPIDPRTHTALPGSQTIAESSDDTSIHTPASTTDITTNMSSTKHSPKRTTTTTTTASVAAAICGSPPMALSASMVGGSCSPSGGGGSGSSSSTGCVRWCMNVALQSFTGEPWAVTLQPAAEDEYVLNGSFHGSPAESTVLPPAATTTTAAANSIRQHPLQHSSGPSPGSPGQGGGNMSGSGSSCGSPHSGPSGTRMSPSMLRSGLQLAAIDYSEPQMQYPGGPVLDASMFGYDPQSEDSAALHQCVAAVNSPPVTYGVDDLLGRITNVEFIAEQSTPEETAAGVPMHYRLSSSLEPMLNATLNPAITAVVDHCVSAIVLVYGATQEMKQMGLIGTPEECGLLPHGIRTMMDRFLERREHQLSKSTSPSSSPKNTTVAATSPSSGNTNAPLTSPPLHPSTNPSSPREDAVGSDGERTEGARSRSGTSQPYSFVFPSIGSHHHRFVRMEATFIAFDSTSIVDLLDLSNKRVELVLKLAPPPTPSAFEEKGDDGNAPAGATATTDSFVLNARAMPVENTNDALSALDVGLENLSRGLELALLQSESGSSLLFSLTAFTDTCRCATMHVLCLAEDPASQTWLASTVQARSQAIPLGEEQSWASIQNTPMPPPLHHHAATMLVPALCFGNMFTSVLICVYNSITALSRLNRDLTFAVTGYRMRTIPRVTLASSRRGLKKLPPSWEEYFTNDGRRYFIDTTTQTTTWEDPRFTQPLRPSRSGSTGSCPSTNNSPGGGPNRSGSNPHHRPSRIALGNGDRDFLANRLQQELHGCGSPTGSPSANKSVAARQALAQFTTADAADDALDIGIVVVDTMCRPRVLIGTDSPCFAQQFREQEEVLREKQRELEAASEVMRRELEEKAAATSATASPSTTEDQESTNGPLREDSDPVMLPVTAAPSELVQNIADPTAVPRHPDVGELPPAPVSGFMGLDDVDDEEVSSFCRSSTSHMDDFMFDETDSEADERAEYEPGDDRTAAASAVTVPGSNAEARFYANALQEQAVGVAEMNAVAAAENSVAASVTSTPQLGIVVAASSAAGTADDRDRNSTSESVLPGSVMTAVPPEIQDLESLVDEFSTFYRKAYETQARVLELESELAELRQSAQAGERMSEQQREEVGNAAQLLAQASDLVQASSSAVVREAVQPLLSNTAATAPAANAAVLAALREVLRIAEGASGPR